MNALKIASVVNAAGIRFPKEILISYHKIHSTGWLSE
jgi:hypothetical protein